MVFERAQLRIVHRRENLSTLSEYVADFKQVTNRFLLPILSSYAPLEAAAFAIDLGLRVARIDGYAIHAIWLKAKTGWM
jgi:hypothetical protein